MRKLILAGWIGVLLMTGTVAAQQPSAEPWANKLFGGVTSKDFGMVAKGAQLKYTFKVTNIYKIPLDITNVRVTCGCVTVKDRNGNQFGTPESSHTIQPNESTELHINMDSRRVNGHKAIQIFVTVGPQYISTATLTVQATTRQDVVLNPGAIDFGIVHRGAAPSQFIDVEHAGAPNWRLEEIVKNSNAPFELRVEDLKAKLGAGRTGYRIIATLKADAAPGQFTEEILLKTNDATSQVMTFTISGNVQAPLAAVPSTVTLTSLKAGSVVEQKVAIRGSRPFRIARVDGQGQGITASFAADRLANMHVIVVRCQLEQVGDLHKILTVVSSLDNEMVPIAIEAHGEK